MDENINLADNSLMNVIRDGIVGDIHFAVTNKRYRATLILVFSGIDAMGWIDRPENRENTIRDDFISWADEFISFQGGKISGIELYSARCAILHSYGSISDLTRKGKARQIGFHAGGGPDIAESDEVPDLVMVSIEGLAMAFRKGVIAYLEKLKSSSVRRSLASKRLELMIHIFPF